MIVHPCWPVPLRVKSIITTRENGVSKKPFDSFNIATHVGDNPELVSANRQVLENRIQQKITWLSQVHGTRVVPLSGFTSEVIEADGCSTLRENTVCGVSTADCLPVLVCDKNGTQVAALHAGWRGLADGILSEGVAGFGCSAKDLFIYIGPAISQTYFEVGPEVLDYFKTAWLARHLNGDVSPYFMKKENIPGKYFADLIGLAKAELNQLGVQNIYCDHYCTWKNNDLFYSYRKEGQTGRFISLVWLED